MSSHTNHVIPTQDGRGTQGREIGLLEDLGKNKACMPQAQWWHDQGP